MAPVTGAPAWAGAPTPAPRWEYGLQSQAIVVTGGTRLAYAGVEYEVNECSPSTCWDHACPPDGEPVNARKDSDPDDQDYVTATPFTVYNVSPPCTGGYALDRAQDRARERLAATEWQAVERAFQSGLCGQSPSLSMGDPVMPAGNRLLSIEDALSYLEYGMRDWGAPGIIHAPREAWPYLRSFIVRDGNQLETELGHGWALGRGYTTVAPGEQEPGNRQPVAADGTTWLYATGTVRIWRSQIMTPGTRETTFDWRHNATRAVAERTYTIGYACRPIAVRVDLSGGGGEVVGLTANVEADPADPSGYTALLTWDAGTETITG